MWRNIYVWSCATPSIDCFISSGLHIVKVFSIFSPWGCQWTGNCFESSEILRKASCQHNTFQGLSICQPAVLYRLCNCIQMVFEVAVTVGGMFVCSTILVRYGKVYYVFGLIVLSFVFCFLLAFAVFNCFIFPCCLFVFCSSMIFQNSWVCFLCWLSLVQKKWNILKHDEI